MWELRVCRGCFCTNSKLQKCNDHMKMIYRCITGLMIEDCDGYPNFFCVECISHLKKMFSLRRKMRRAYFVMKEILLKKKQITYMDVTTVDRRKTNLKSALGYWKPKCVGFYTINTEEEEPNIDKPVLVIDKTKEASIRQYRPETNGYVRHIVNIKPQIQVEQLLETLFTDNVKSEDKVENSDNCQNNNNTQNCDDNQDNDDHNNETTLEITDNIQNIDLNNVFEDLVENEDSDYSLPDEFPMKIKKPKKKVLDESVKELESVIFKSVKAQYASKVLENCDLKILSHEEQVLAFNIRRNMPPYVTATYKCGVCLTVYNSLDDLKKHIKIHNRNFIQPYMCSICLIKYSTAELLELHNSEVHKYSYKCRECDGKELFTLEGVIKHELHEKDEEQETNLDIFNVVPNSMEEMMSSNYTYKYSRYECDMCKLRFRCPTTLKKHRLRHTPKALTTTCCIICFTWYLNKHKADKHMEKWHLRRYECKLCPDVLINFSEAKYHQHKIHHVATKIKCKYCGKMVKSMGIHLHLAKYHAAEALRHECVVCGRSFTTAKNLYLHQFQEHKRLFLNDLSVKEDDSRCKVCNIQFLSVQSYRKHAVRKRHEDAQFFENTCIKCYRIFDTEEVYKNHMETMHRTAAKYPRKCSYCDKVFKSYKTFYLHMTRTHCNVVSESKHTKLCEICGLRTNLMEKHKQKHENSTDKFTCEYCNPPKVFVWGRDLIKHVVSAHTPLPYICALCNQSFGGRLVCLDHILKLHAPELPFKCETCQRCFSHIDHLSAHAKSAHNIAIKKGLQYLRNKMNHTLFVYPHMKINLSLIKPELIKLVNLKLFSYDNTKSENIKDPTDFIVLDNYEGIVEGYAAKEKKLKSNFNDLDDNKRVGVKRKRMINKVKEDNIENEDKKVIIKNEINLTIREEVIDVASNIKRKKAKNTTSILKGYTAKKKKLKFDFNDLKSNKRSVDSQKIIDEENDIENEKKLINKDDMNLSLSEKVIDYASDVKSEASKDPSAFIVLYNNEEIFEGHSERTSFDNQSIIDEDNHDEGDTIEENEEKMMIYEDEMNLTRDEEVIQVDSEVVNNVCDVIEEDSDEKLVINDKLDVFVQNGEQYVLINGVIYKVDTSG